MRWGLAPAFVVATLAAAAPTTIGVYPAAATPAEARATSIAYLDRHSARLARLIREPSGVIGHSLRLARALESDDRRAILASLAALR